MAETRQPAVAGAFYPSNKQRLESMIDDFLDNAVKADIKGHLKGIIVPHAGYIYSGIVAAAGFKLLQSLQQNKKWKVLLIGPSHRADFYGAASSGFDEWQTPLGNIKVKNLADEIRKTKLVAVSDEDGNGHENGHEESKLVAVSDEVMQQEHSLEVEVPFLQKVLNDFELYPLCLGDINPELLAKELRDFVKREDVIVVVSSDLSHYYTYDEAKQLDDFANKYIPRIIINEVHDRVEACGIKGILTLLHIADELGWRGHFVDYKNSGDTSGDKSQVVGYGCYAFSASLV